MKGLMYLLPRVGTSCSSCSSCSPGSMCFVSCWGRLGGASGCVQNVLREYCCSAALRVNTTTTTTGASDSSTQQRKHSSSSSSSSSSSTSSESLAASNGGRLNEEWERIAQKEIKDKTKSITDLYWRTEEVADKLHIHI